MSGFLKSDKMTSAYDKARNSGLGVAEKVFLDSGAERRITFSDFLQNQKTGRMSIRTLIVDDEPLARERIRWLLAEESDIEIIGEAPNGSEAVLLINELKPDLVFLDIQMPELSGFDVLQAVSAENPFHVVFVTAYDSYAIHAFDIHAIDYLLKPIIKERLDLALERVRTEIKNAANYNMNELLTSFINNFRQTKTYTDRVLVKTSGRIFFVQTSEIDWIESCGNYVMLHIGREKYLLRNTMKTMEDRLDPYVFLRIHRSSLVNINHIKEIYPLFSCDYNVILKNGTELTLSRHYRDRLLELFNM